MAIAYPLAIIAGVMATSLEMMYKNSKSFTSILWIVMPIQTLMSYCLFRLIHASGGIMEAFVLFSITTLTLRLAIRLLSAQEIGFNLWVAYGLIVVAQVVKNIGK